MNSLLRVIPSKWLALLLAGLLWTALGQAATAAETDPPSAAALRAKFTELGPQLANNPFGRPLYLDSTESPNRLQADIYALVEHPFATVRASFIDPVRWCDMLILHLNIKYCRAANGKAPSVIAVSIGKKTYEELSAAYPVQFSYNARSNTPDYLDVSLLAEKGPLGTSDYSIRLETVALPGGKTFLHLSYSYAYGFIGRVAMQAYLATIGRGKVGFTRTGGQSGSPTAFIDGVRAAVERNTMRYYLAIDAYLGAASTPPAEQFEKRLQDWFSATELYATQLHEVERGAYLDMKRREYLRMHQ
jgi:hypothetical protein